jgi:hypothetical protein
MPDPVQFDPNFFLLDLLNLTPEYLCKDPRDRIISLMGLVPYKQRLCISADYSIPCAELYINFARNMINTDSRFMLLSCAQRDKLTSLELPSWVPDVRTSLFYKRLLPNYGIFCYHSMYSKRLQRRFSRLP